MSSNMRSPQESKAENIQRMGESLGTTYSALWQHVAKIHAKWSEHVVLFGTKESRIDLLNSAAPSFCRLVQDSIWENVILHIARLTDPVATGKRQNLTVQRLSTVVDDAATKAKVEALVVMCLTASEFARDWRNRHLAHNDFDLSISNAAKPLEPASRLKVNEVLSSFSEILNAVSSHYLDTTTFFESFDGDSESILYVIGDGLEAEKRRRDRRLSGKYDPDEYKPRDL